MRIVDDALTSASYELEFADEELDDDALGEATERLVGQVRQLRDDAELLAELVREQG